MFFVYGLCGGSSFLGSAAGLVVDLKYQWNGYLVGNHATAQMLPPLPYPQI